MKMNKSYYCQLNADLQIESAEVDHVSVEAPVLELIKSTVSEPLESGSLFTGDHVEEKKVKKFDIRTGKTVEFSKVENLANLAIDEGFVRVVEYNMSTRQLRLWIQTADYKKQTSSASSSSKGGPKF